MREGLTEKLGEVKRENLREELREVQRMGLRGPPER